MTNNKKVQHDLAAHEKKFIDAFTGSETNKKMCCCPNCGYKEPRQFTIPCYHKRCPRCDSPLSEC